MIVKPKQYGFFGLLLEMRGSVIPAIMPKIIFAVCVGVVVTLVLSMDLLGEDTDEILSLNFTPFTALGVAISLFLGFHNNASYGRWWEARILWGRQIIVCRDLARFLIGIIDEDDTDYYSPTDEKNVFQKSCTPTQVDSSNSADSPQNTETTDDDIEKNVESLWLGSVQSRQRVKHTDPRQYKYKNWQHHIICLSVAHTHGFRHQMRPSCKRDKTSAMSDRNRFLNPDEERELLRCKNNANTILLFASKVLGKAHKAKKIDTYSMIHVQKTIDGLCTIQTACERIHNTSLPLAYSLLVHRTSVLYVMLVPFAIAPTMGWWTPVFTAIVAYTFFGLDQLAKDIQEPFRDSPMCLALSAMSRTIEIDALEIMGEETPPFLKQHGNVLM